MKNPPKGPPKTPRLSPLYTSKTTELTKRTVVADKGKDTDGAYRATGRKDAQS